MGALQQTSQAVTFRKLEYRIEAGGLYETVPASGVDAEICWLLDRGVALADIKVSCEVAK